MAERLVPLRPSGVRLALAGHEHNFQYAVDHGVHYVLSGAAGKLRPERPDAEGFARGRTRAWAGEGQFLVVELDAERAVVRPLTAGADGALRPVRPEAPDGTPLPSPIVVPRTSPSGE